MSLGLFAMPSTLSLFSGQHTFYNGSSVDCKKCHANVYDEIENTVSTAHTNSKLKKCEACHRTGPIDADLVPLNSTSNGTNGEEIGANITANKFFYGNGTNTTVVAHAAITVECVACHTGVPAE
ncbi:MAG: hypothetical protein ACE5KT_00950, partial [Methanosarcinales archaeon]